MVCSAREQVFTGTADVPIRFRPKGDVCGRDVRDPGELYVQRGVQGVVLDELAAGLDDFAHEFGKEIVGFVGVLHLDEEERARVERAADLSSVQATIHARLEEAAETHMFKPSKASP